MVRILEGDLGQVASFLTPGTTRRPILSKLANFYSFVGCDSAVREANVGTLADSFSSVVRILEGDL
jgi:hypothetical protein